MFRIFRRTAPPSVRALKLYSVWSLDKAKVVDRPALVEGLLSVGEKFFGSLPREFDIHGPYGISKGRSVGIKAFRNKLAKRGHADYYALDGYCADSFGFSGLFSAKTRAGHCYDELLVWFAIGKYAVEILDLADDLIRLFPTDYGYVADFPSDYNPLTESRRRKTLSGFTLKEDREHSTWRSAIPVVLDGRIRNVYRYNFLNRKQAEALASLGFPAPIRVTNEVSALVLTNDAEFEECKRRYTHLVPTA
jgi:hypothetical protein